MKIAMRLHNGYGEEDELRAQVEKFFGPGLPGSPEWKFHIGKRQNGTGWWFYANKQGRVASRKELMELTH